MGLSADDKTYIEELLKPLARADQFEQFKSEVNSRLDEQDKRIDALYVELEAQQKRFEIIESDNALKDNTIKILKLKSDQNEQYSRRHSLRIHNIQTKANETNDDIMNIVKSCCESLKVPFNRQDISRAHRIGKIIEVEEKDRRGNFKKTGKKTQSVIVKFKEWDPRTALYVARPRYEPGRKSDFTISLDLTHHRQQLLENARVRTEKVKRIKFCFADKNCIIGFRTVDDQMRFFNSMEELEKLLLRDNE